MGGVRVLTRVGTSSSEPPCEIEIILTRHKRATGYPERGYESAELAADVFSASVKVPDTQELVPGLIIKVLDSTSRLVSSQLVRDFELEAECHVQAESAQGTALPRFVGLFTSDSVYFLVFENAGRWLTDEEVESKEVRDEAVRAFDEIVEAGVVPHVDFRGQIRRGRDGHIKIATLWGATSITKYTPEYIQTLKPWAAGKSPQELLQLCAKSGREGLCLEFDCEDSDVEEL